MRTASGDAPAEAYPETDSPDDYAPAPDSDDPSRDSQPPRESDRSPDITLLGESGQLRIEVRPDDASVLATEAFVEPLARLTPRAPKPNVLRIAAAVVTDPAGRSLLVRKRGSEIFMQPGGKIESGESALTALTRELREELGLVVDPAETEYIGSYRAVAANEENTVVRAEVFFLTTSELPVAGAEIDELLWVERLDDLAVEVAPLSRDSLLPLWAARSSTLF